MLCTTVWRMRTRGARSSTLGKASHITGIFLGGGRCRNSFSAELLSLLETAACSNGLAIRAVCVIMQVVAARCCLQSNFGMCQAAVGCCGLRRFETIREGQDGFQDKRQHRTRGRIHT
eukprot:15436539-Alexandrium_andersonii.AAC.1